jgi:hypothetical protein
MGVMLNTQGEPRDGAYPRPPRAERLKGRWALFGLGGKKSAEYVLWGEWLLGSVCGKENLTASRPVGGG